MSEIVMTTEAEVEEFADDLSDEALDRAEGALSASETMLFSHSSCDVGGS